MHQTTGPQCPELPAVGWTVIGHHDHGAPTQRCARCGTAIRYAVIMRHPTHQGHIQVGTRCSIWLSGRTPEPLAPHDAPATPSATVNAEAAIEALESADKYGAKLGENAEIAVWLYAGNQWIHWLDARREGVPLPEMRRRAGLVPGASVQVSAPYEISLRRLAQIADHLVEQHREPIAVLPGLPAPPPEMLLMHLPREERRAALAAQART